MRIALWIGTLASLLVALYCFFGVLWVVAFPDVYGRVGHSFEFWGSLFLLFIVVFLACCATLWRTRARTHYQVEHQPRSTKALGAISLCAFLIDLLVLAGWKWSRGDPLIWLLAFFGLAMVGFFLGIAGLISSRGLGRMPVASIVGCILNLPPVAFGLMGVALVLGQRH